MALFKIYNNIDSKNSLPTTSKVGYCYFDATSNLFYIDIKDGEDIDLTDETYRVPLNAAKAAYASKALNDFNGNKIHETYLPLEGGTMVGALNLYDDPTTDLEAATKRYVDEHSASGTFLRQDTTVVSASASVLIPAPIKAAMAVDEKAQLLIYQNGLLLLQTTNYAVSSEGETINLVNYKCDPGDTFTFIVMSNGLKLSDFVDSSYLPLAGGTMTGALTLAGGPIDDAHAATKKYVDDAVADVDVTEQLQSYLPLAGGTMTGSIIGARTQGTWINGTHNSAFKITTTPNADAYSSGLAVKTPAGSWSVGTLGENFHFVYGTDANFSAQNNTTANGVRITNSSQLYGAVWNDYAEYRSADTTEPGRCVVELGDDRMTLASTRMQPGAAIISDTFGFAIGQTEDAQTPIAISGRVLARPLEPLSEFRRAIGKPVCSGPNGTVSIMTDKEYAKKGYCAIGTVSAVPDYETWGESNVPVNGRVWIQVK